MNKDNSGFSDEYLNAYLDNELASEERKCLVEALRDDQDLRQRVCKFEQVRNMLSVAFHDIPEPESLKVVSPSRSSFYSIAASVLVVFTFALGGWYGHAYFDKGTSLTQLATAYQINKPTSSDKTSGVLLHVTSDDPYRINAVLDEVEIILSEAEAKQTKISVQILANGAGLNMLHNIKSPYGKRIAELQTRYSTLVFTACAKAMDRIQKVTGKTIPLLPNVGVTRSALSEALYRQREGWTYIKI